MKLYMCTCTCSCEEEASQLALARRKESSLNTDFNLERNSDVSTRCPILLDPTNSN